MKKYLEFIFILLWLTVIGYILQRPYFDEFPRYSNARDQSNNLAITQGFILNNFDFLEPQTFVYNKETLENEELILTEDQQQINNTRTAVHFPIHHFLPAYISNLFDWDLVKTNRWYTFIFSIIGSFFLYRLIRLLTHNFFKSFLLISFAISVPVYVYYQNGFLPVIPSLSLAIIGIYMYFSYHTKSKIIYYLLALTCITLASLSTYFFSSILLSIFAAEIYVFIKKWTYHRGKLILNVASSTLIILSISLYLRREKIYGSVFTDIQNMELSSKFGSGQFGWSLYETIHIYYSNVQLILLSLIVLGFLISYFFYSRGILKLTFIKPFWQFLLVYFICSFTFLYFIPASFEVKDHLFIATFYLPILLLVTLLTKHLSFQHRTIKIFYTTTGLGIILTMILSANSIQEEKRISGNWDIATETVYNYADSQEFLEKNGVKANDRILVFNSITPNVPFMLMNRTGYAIAGESKADIIEALSWRYQYIIYQNQFFISTVYTEYPEIIQRIEIIATNGKITLCKIKRDPTQRNTLTTFLNFDKLNSLGTYYNNFSSDEIDNWQIDSLYQKVVYSKPYSNIMRNETLEGLKFMTNRINLGDSNRHLMYLEGQFYQDSLQDCELIGYIYEGTELVYQQSYHLNRFVNKPQEWFLIQLVYEFPRIKSKNCIIGFQITNPKKAKLIMDDITLKIF